MSATMERTSLRERAAFARKAEEDAQARKNRELVERKRREDVERLLAMVFSVLEVMLDESAVEWIGDMPECAFATVVIDGLRFSAEKTNSGAILCLHRRDHFGVLQNHGRVFSLACLGQMLAQDYDFKP